MFNRIASSRISLNPLRPLLALAALALLAAGGFLALSLTPGQTDVASAQGSSFTERGITVSKSDLGNLKTGESATYTIVLTAEPNPWVSVSPVVSNLNANFTVSPDVHWFDADNWDQPQTFTVTAQQDHNDSIHGRATIGHTAWIYRYGNEDDYDWHSFSNTISVGETDISECPTAAITTTADTFRVTGQAWRWNTNPSSWGDRGDCQSQFNEGNRQGKWIPARYYAFRIAESAPARDVTITMETDRQEPALYVRSGSKTGTVLARHDTDKRGARVRLNLGPGLYVIEATTPGWDSRWTGPEAGTFELTVTGLNNDVDNTPECNVTAPPPAPPPTDPGVPPAPPNLTWQGSWDGSCDSYWRKPYKHNATRSNARWYKFHVANRAMYTITLKTSDSNAWLFLRSGANAKSGSYIVQNDYDAARGDYYDNYNFPWDARIQRWLDPGWYTVEATNWRSGIKPPHEIGDFTLNVKETRLMPSGQPTATGVTLALDGWNPKATPISAVDQDVLWYYQADTGPYAACSTAQSGTTLNLTGLSPNTIYRYTAYQDAGCTDVIAATALKTLPVLVLNDDWGGPKAVPEGSSATYHVRLRSQPSADVSVSIVAGAGDINILVQDTDDATSGNQTTAITFTPSNWSTNRTVTLTAAPDSDILEGTRAIVHTATSTDALFNGETATLTAVEVEGTKGIVLSPASLSVPENGDATYTVRLSVAPVSTNTTVQITEGTTAPNDDTSISVYSPSSRTLTFTPTNWKTPQTVTLRAADDTDSIAGTRAFAHAASGGGYSNVNATLVATEDEDDRKVVFRNAADSADITALNVPEGGSATYKAKLNMAPNADVTVNLTATGDADITFSPSSLTFTTTNYSTAQTVTVRAAADNNDVGNGTKTITHTASGAGSGYENLTSALTVTEQDDDTSSARILLRNAADSANITTLGVTEADTNGASYKVKLSHRPGADVNVIIGESTGDGDITVKTPASKTLTFTAANWSTAQTVTLQAADDVDKVQGTRSITHIASNTGGYSNVTATLTATEIEDDSAIIFRNAADNADITTLGSVPEGGSATYKVKLNIAPSANVTVALAVSGDDSFTVSPTSLSFTANNYSSARTVTVRAAQDTDVLNGSANITHTASGSGSGYDGVTAALGATEADDDKGEIVIRNAAANADITGLDVPENGTATYRVELSKQPQADVTVAISAGSGDPDITVKDTDDSTSGDQTTDITFTTSNWNTARAVILAAAEDSGAAMDGTRTITHTASGANSGYAGVTKNLTAKELDNDKTVILMDSSGQNDISSITVTEGSTATYRVKLGHRPEGGNVTVTLTAAGDTDITVTNPSSKTLTFTTNNWSSLQSVTLTAANDSDTATWHHDHHSRRHRRAVPRHIRHLDGDGKRHRRQHQRRQLRPAGAAGTAGIESAGQRGQRQRQPQRRQHRSVLGRVRPGHRLPRGVQHRRRVQLDPRRQQP